MGDKIDDLREELRGDMKKLEERLHSLERSAPPPRVIEDFEARLRSLERKSSELDRTGEFKVALTNEETKREELSKQVIDINNKLAWYAGAVVGISTLLSAGIALAGLFLK